MGFGSQPINMKIPNYKIIKEIGAGGMGSVYLAEHTLIKRKVAIKSLKQDLIKNEQLRERFKKEATALAQLEHPNIVRLNEYIEQQDGVFLIMEYVDGLPLDEHINNVSGPINEEQLIPLFLQILDAFEYAHKNKIVHRDIKPSNIIITKDGKIKVLDFGIAKIMDETNSMTKTGTQMGSVLYMSPEQVKGEKVNHLSDIYSLGVTLYQMATGKAPYDPTSNEYEVFQKIDKEALPKASSIYPGVSKKIEEIIEKATNKNSSNRFQSCSEFKKSLSKKDLDETIISKKVKPVNTNSIKTEAIVKEEKKKNPIIIILIIGFLLAGIGGYFYFDSLPKEFTNYYDKDWEKCKKENAEFYRIISLDKQGKPVGIVKNFYITGELQWEGYLYYYDEFKSVNDSSQGIAKMYYKNGKLERTMDYEKNLLNGKVVNYDSLGFKIIEREYKMGVKDGIAKFFDNGYRGPVPVNDDEIKHFLTFRNDTLNGKVETDYGYFGDSIKIEGNFINGELNGYGKVVWLNGNRYEGEFKNDLRHGTGKFYFADGEVLSGIWKKGELVKNDNEDYSNKSSSNTNSVNNSNNKTLNNDPNCTSGTCENGWGVYVYKDGKYKGAWKNGKKTGKGTYNFANGNKYVGEFKDNDKSGIGTFTWWDGENYVGEFKYNDRSGIGRYTFTNGNKYVGEFKDGNFNGLGIYITTSNGKKQIGIWKDDKLIDQFNQKEECVSGDCVNGFGTYLMSNGSLCSGYWKNDNRNGKVIIIYPDGRVFRGLYINDVINGIGTFIQKDGSIYKGNWRNNKRSGYGTLYKNDGTIESKYW